MASVADTYAHGDKMCTPREGVTASGIPLKWYDIGARDEPVLDDVRDRAVAYLKSKHPMLGGDLGFVILHRCGDGATCGQSVTRRRGAPTWPTIIPALSEATP